MHNNTNVLIVLGEVILANFDNNISLNECGHIYVYTVPL